MSSEQILNKILDSTYTLNDLFKRVRILKRYLTAKLFENSQPNDQEMNSEISWLSSLGEDFYQQFNPQNVYQVFEELEKKIESISPLSIYFAYQPTNEDIVNIGIWLRKNTQNNQLFDIKYDRDLIGGCALVLNGTYKDYSLRAQIQQNLDKVGSIIRSSLNSK